jgi:hypothetical protein
VSRAGTATALGALLGALLGVAPVGPAPAAQPPGAAQVVSLHDQAREQARAPKPQVSRLTASSGSTTGGYDVVVKGRGLTGVKRVLFGTVKATSVRAKSARKLVVTAPPHGAGQVDVRVVTDHGASKRSQAARFTYVIPQPVLTGLSPSAGPSAGGTTLILTGRDLTAAISVRLGTSLVSYRSSRPPRSRRRRRRTHPDRSASRSPDRAGPRSCRRRSPSSTRRG